MQIPLIGKKYNLRMPEGSQNWCLSFQKTGDQANMQLYSRPGMKTWHDFGEELPIRGMLATTQWLYVAFGNTLYRLNSEGTATSIGTLLTNSGRVQMISNGVQGMCIDGQKGYYWTIGGSWTFSQITDTDFPGVLSLAYQDGYGIVSGTRHFYLSSGYDFSAWDALDYASKEGWPDNISAVLTDHRELWLFGRETSEVWWNSGAADFPFARLDGAFIELGLGAQYSPVKLDNSVFWLTDRRTVVRADGYNPVRVSTDALDYQFRGYSRVDDAFGYPLHLEGHSFYVLTFPTADKTWVFDAATGMWTRWASGPHDRRFRAGCSGFFAEKNLVGDRENGKIYELDPETFADDGEEIRRVWDFEPIESPNRNIVFHKKFEVEFKSGVGLEEGSDTGSDPMTAMQYSDDGGRTWTNEKQANVGKAGAFSTRAIWRRLGRSRNRVYRVIATAPVEWIVLAAYADVAEGMS